MADAIEGVEATPSTIMTVPVAKSKGSVEIDTAKLSDEVYQEALLQGLKVLVARGMSKITKSELGDEATVRKEAQVKAEANVQAIYAGKIKFSGKASASKVTGEVKTEAMRLARNIVKDELKAAKIKISTVEASEITRAAKLVLEANPELLTKAAAALEERKATKVKGIDVSKIAISPELVAKAEKAKAEKKGQLSAKQAGMTTKAKGGGKPATATAH